MQLKFLIIFLFTNLFMMNMDDIENRILQQGNYYNNFKQKKISIDARIRTYMALKSIIAYSILYYKAKDIKNLMKKNLSFFRATVNHLNPFSSHSIENFNKKTIFTFFLKHIFLLAYFNEFRNFNFIYDDYYKTMV